MYVFLKDFVISWIFSLKFVGFRQFWIYWYVFRKNKKNCCPLKTVFCFTDMASELCWHPPNKWCTYMYILAWYYCSPPPQKNKKKYSCPCVQFSLCGYLHKAKQYSTKKNWFFPVKAVAHFSESYHYPVFP